MTAASVRPGGYPEPGCNADRGVGVSNVRRVQDFRPGCDALVAECSGPPSHPLQQDRGVGRSGVRGVKDFCDAWEVLNPAHLRDAYPAVPTTSPGGGPVDIPGPGPRGDGDRDGAAELVSHDYEPNRSYDQSDRGCGKDPGGDQQPFGRKSLGLESGLGNPDLQGAGGAPGHIGSADLSMQGLDASQLFVARPLDTRACHVLVPSVSISEQPFSDQNKATNCQQRADAAQYFSDAVRRRDVGEVGIVVGASQRVHQSANASEAQQDQTAADTPVHGGNVAIEGAA